MEKKMKQVSSNEDGLLTELFRKVIYETGYINSMLPFINTYIRNGGKRSKATVTKIILDGEMTWKSFIFLMFEILPVKKMSISLKLDFMDGTSSEHSLDVEPLHQTNKEDKGDSNGTKPRKSKRRSKKSSSGTK